MEAFSKISHGVLQAHQDAHGVHDDILRNLGEDLEVQDDILRNLDEALEALKGNNVTMTRLIGDLGIDVRERRVREHRDQELKVRDIEVQDPLSTWT